VTLFPSGSTLWMIRHDVRLTWRRFSTGRKNNVGLIITLILLVIPVVVGGAMGGWALRLIPEGKLPGLAPVMTLVADGILTFLFGIMLAQNLSAATIAFFDRGDLDLLLSSPVKPHKVLAVRMLAMVFNSSWGFVALVASFLLSAATVGRHPGLLAGFPILISFSLLTTALGVLLAMGLFKLIGPRRTRTVAQVLGAVIGASVFLTSQLPNILGHSNGNRYEHMAKTLFAHSAAQPGWVTWPARAVIGQPLPLLSIVVPSVLLFVLVLWVLGRRFADNAAAVAGAPERLTVQKSRAGAFQFKTGLNRVMVIKELKLVFRDPALVSQVLLQCLYLIPASFMIVRGIGSAGGGLLSAAAYASGAGVVTFMAGQLAAGFGWLTISAEEAPELLICAPISQGQVAKAKVMAVAIPTLAILTIPIVAIAWFSFWAAICALTGAVACCVAIAFVELWTQKPAKKADFRMRRRGSGSGWTFFFEFVVGSMFGAAAGLMAFGGLIAAGALVPLGIAGAVLAAIKKDKWLNA
jgi:ABC-2 type transport system permease protein